MDDDSKQPEEQVDLQPEPEDPSPESNKPPETIDDPAPVSAEPEDSVSWTASEFVSHEKSASWYAGLALVTLVLVVAVFLLVQDIFSVVAIILVAIIFGFAAGRAPRSMQYVLDNQGVMVNNAYRRYSDFKSFSVLKEGAIDCITFLPIKRLGLPLTVYIEPQNQDTIVQKLSKYLPLDQTHDHDVLDRFIQRIRF